MNSLFLIVVFGVISYISTNENSENISKILDSLMDENPKDLFNAWHSLFRKEYTLGSDESQQRFQNFKKKLDEIKEHNSKGLPYKIGLNQFSDMTNEEFEKIYLTEHKPEDPSENFLSVEDDYDLNRRNLQNYTEINWTSVFPPIRNQGACGSCWAFAASGAVDGNRGIKLNRSEYSSPQQLVDCDSSNFGCNGGYYPYTFRYIQLNGLMMDRDYPYNASTGTCNFKTNATLLNISGIKYCNNDLAVICKVSTVYGLVKQGPLAVSVDASGLFASYKSGVYTAACKSSNHAVVLAGYGYDAPTNLNYWLVRNSWGSTWGDRGYIKIAVNDSNKFSCFITNRAYLPLVVN
jgi:C1A family cysteine protease